MRLAVEALAAERGGRAVFSGLSFTAGAGTLLRVSGANGAGKTTLLRILAGLAAASDGSVVWRDGHHTVAAATASCFAGHANAMNDALTVQENLTYAAALAGCDVSAGAIEAALDAFAVKSLGGRRFGSLSQGQRKRSSLARLSLDSQPGNRAWLLDEPFVALDANTQTQLADMIAAKLAAGGLVVYTSHQSVPIDAAIMKEILL